MTTRTPTYTNLIRESIINDYLLYNAVVILIYKPSLGLTDSITSLQLEARKELTMEEVAAAEIGGDTLKGYARFILDNATITNDTDSTSTISSSSTNLEATFTGKGADLDPFTHIVVARGVNLTNASTTNGNNRGNTSGSVIYVEPVVNSPLVLQKDYTFRYTVKFALATKATI